MHLYQPENPVLLVIWHVFHKCPFKYHLHLLLTFFVKLLAPAFPHNSLEIRTRFYNFCTHFFRCRVTSRLPLQLGNQAFHSALVGYFTLFYHLLHGRFISMFFEESIFGFLFLLLFLIAFTVFLLLQALKVAFFQVFLEFLEARSFFIDV